MRKGSNVGAGRTATTNPKVQMMRWDAKEISRSGNVRPGLGETKALEGAAGGDIAGDSFAGVGSSDARRAGAGGVRQSGTLALPTPGAVSTRGTRGRADR